MGRFEKLTKFIPVLDAEDIGVWITDHGAPHVEYQEVVFRLCDAVLAFADEHPELAGEGGNKALSNLVFAFGSEERIPGLLLGYLLNGSITAWLKELEAADNG
ncbi:MAG: hypothetical protein K6G56_01825 [Clostridiales bacterium]|nr:hypothetical protein [Clostridiales bacterium]